MPSARHPDVLVGPENCSDAGVFRLREDLAIVQTTDFFPPLVDDPYVFGQIAAANSLSDIYAMGATPITCLNIVCFPDKELPLDILHRILAGGAAKVAEAGAVILGGHSVRDTEIKYGLAVTGVVHPDHYLTNDGAQPGDRLILTKPLGSGVMTSAVKAGRIAAEALDETIAVMTQLNAAAARVAREVGAHAATDITGFGLVGHAFEMAEASEACLEIDAPRVPLIAGVMEQARAGVLTRAAKSNVEHVGAALEAGGVDETLAKVLADAQTSGGLLLSVPAGAAETALAALRSAGVTGAAEIGRVVEAGPGRVVLRP